MIKINSNRYLRSPWTFKQPLTRIPSLEKPSISDLFVWRRSKNWQTFFELIDIYSLFKSDESPGCVDMIIFDQKGKKIFIEKINLQESSRQTLDISSKIKPNQGEIGTFAVFHSKTPPEIIKMGSFLSERGYTSYQYKNSPLRSYVHGNFDAIAKGEDDSLELVGGSGFLRRDYNLQYQLQTECKYELAMVNPTPFTQNIICNQVSLTTGKTLNSQKQDISSGGVHIFNVEVSSSEAVRVVIKSHLIMGRPIIFKNQNLKVDVFHG
jgi:hypothetical protein